MPQLVRGSHCTEATVRNPTDGGGISALEGSPSLHYRRIPLQCCQLDAARGSMMTYILMKGHEVEQLDQALCDKPEGRRVRFPMRSLDFSIGLILPAAQWRPGVDSASKRNEYQESFWR
jgi:hypothetical protein